MKNFATPVLALILAVALGFGTPLAAQQPQQQPEPPAGQDVTSTIPFEFLRTLAGEAGGNLAPPEAEWICRSDCYKDLGRLLRLLKDSGLELVSLNVTYSWGSTFNFSDGSFESFWLLEGTVTVKGSAADVEFAEWLVEIGVPVL